MITLNEGDEYRYVINRIGEAIGENVRSDHPLMGESLHGLTEIADAVKDIASVMEHGTNHATVMYEAMKGGQDNGQCNQSEGLESKASPDRQRQPAR